MLVSNVFSFFILFFGFLNPRDPITLSEDEQGVYNHLQNARYSVSVSQDP